MGPNAAFADHDEGSLATSNPLMAMGSASTTRNSWVSKPRIKDTVIGHALKPTAKARFGKVVFLYSASKNGPYRARSPKKIGTWYLKATVKGAGTKKNLVSAPVAFRILPKAPAFKNVIAGQEKITLKWNAGALNTQIQCSREKSFENSIGAWAKSGVKNKTLNKLEGGKRYYVRIRSYKTVGGKKIFSKWSKSRSIVTKKRLITTTGDILVREGSAKKAATLYVTSDWASNYLKQPASLKSSLKIGVVKVHDAPRFDVLSGTSVTVDDNGRVKPNSQTFYWKDGWGSTAEPEDMTGVTVSREYKYGPSVIGVTIGSKVYKIEVDVKSYEEHYADEVMNDFVKKNIKPEMTQYEKLEAIVKYTAQKHDYSVDFSSATGMIVSGGGDCWASTDLICSLAKKVGLKARSHRANWEPLAGSGHYNAQVLADEDIYECEAGYGMSSPRPYSLQKYTNGFKYYVENDKAYLTQYATFGTPEKVTIPSKIDGYEVAGITREIFYDMTATDNVPIKEIFVPSTVTELNEKAFFTATDKVQKVQIESGNTAFANENGAVYSKDKKKLYYIPTATKGDFAINTETTEISAFACAFASGLRKITGMNNVQVIGDEAFWRSGITSISLPKSVTTIGYGAFAESNDCTVTVNSEDAFIDQYAFRDIKCVKGYANSTAQNAAERDEAKFVLLS